MKMNDIISNSSTFTNENILNDFKLKNGASVKSIKIPLIQNESNKNNNSNYFNSQNLLSITQPKIQASDNQNTNNNDTDLTELSWLTTNVNHMFTNQTTNNLPIPLYVHNASVPSLTVSTNFNTTSYRNNNSNNLNANNQTQIYKHKKYHHKKYTPKSNSSVFNMYSKLDTNFHDIKISSASSCSSSSASSISSINNSPDSPLSSSTTTILSPSTSPFNNSNFTHEKFKNSCGLNKPPLTLSCLIFMSLQESKDKCLPVREIYAWIEENFPYYKNISNGGWKSSIRHNLSFSKCFKKMDKQINNVKSNASQKIVEYSSNGRKRRAPNSNGTCWKVNPECKTYLIQMLKKSTFWFHNSTFYPNLNQYIVDYMNRHQNYDSKSKMNNNSEEEDQENFEDFDGDDNEENEEFDNHIEFKLSKNLKKNALSNDKNKAKLSSKKRLKRENESNEEMNDDACDEVEDDESNDYKFKNTNLLEFVQKQNEKIFNKKEEENNKYEPYGYNFDSNDLAAVCTLASTANKLELSFSSTASSSSFSSLSSSTSSFTSSNYNDFGSSSLNSDLEMEVASTLADMKWFANRKKLLQQQHQ